MNRPPTFSLVCFAISAICFSAVAIDGCAWWTSKGKPAVIDCASAEVKQVEANLGSAVAAILESQDYEAGLIGLATQLGADGIQIISCIVARALHPPGEAMTRLTASQAQMHAVEWLQKHGR